MKMPEGQWKKIMKALFYPLTRFPLVKGKWKIRDEKATRGTFRARWSSFYTSVGVSCQRSSKNVISRFGNYFDGTTTTNVE